MKEKRHTHGENMTFLRDLFWVLKGLVEVGKITVDQMLATFEIFSKHITDGDPKSARPSAARRKKLH